MAKSGAIRAGRAFIEVSGDTTALQAALSQAENRARQFAANMRNLGLQLTGFGAAIATPAVVAEKAFIEFEHQMARVRSITGAGGQQFVDLTERARELGRTTQQGATQAAEAMYAFAQAGFSVDEIMKSVAGTLSLATIADMDVAQAAEIAANIMRSQTIAAEDLARAVDVLTQASISSTTTLQELGYAFKYVGPIGKFAGITFEELAAAIELLSASGIRGEMAGTTLRGAVLSLLSPTEKAAKIIKNLGVTTADAQGKILPLADIIEQFENAFARMSDAAKLQAIGDIFDTRNAAGFAELISQGSQKLRELMREFDATKGIADIIAGAQLDTVWGSLRILSNVVQDLSISFGKVFAPVIRAVNELLQDGARGLSEWIEQHATVVRNMAQIVVIAGAAGVALLGLSVAVQAIAIAFSGLKLVLLPLTASFLLLKATVMAFIAGGPIFAIGAAIAVVAVSIAAHTEALTEAIGAIQERLAEFGRFVARVSSGISDALAGGDIKLAGTLLIEGLTVAWKTAANSVINTWNGVTAELEKTFHDVVAAFLKDIEHFEKMMTDAWLFVVNGMSAAWITFIGGAKAQIVALAGFVAKQFEFLKPLLSAPARAAFGGLASIDTGAVLRAIEDEKNERLAALGAAHAEAMRLNNQEHQAKLAQIEAEAKAAKDHLDELNRAGASRRQAEIDQAESRLQSLLDQAALLRQRAEDDNRFEARPLPRVEVPETTLKGAGLTLERLGSVGAFGGQNIGSLVANPIVEEQQETNAQLRRTNQILTQQVELLRDVGFTVV